jgi:hypothetical protein
MFEKLDKSKHRHMKALYISGFVNGKLMSKIMVDWGTAVNIMPMTTFKKLAKGTDYLIKTNVVLKDFEGNKLI